MIQRGVGYSIDVGGTSFTGVVLTKNHWNDRMNTVGVLPVREPGAPSSPHAVSLPNGGTELDPAYLLLVLQHSVGDAEFVPPDDVLVAAERGLGALIEAERLIRVPPRAARPPAGVVDYPRWGEVYYLSGKRHEGQRKRWLIVSDDRWNQLKHTVLAVRLTSQHKHPSDEFPDVADGSRACCGDLTSVAATRLDLRTRPSEGRTRVSLGGMSLMAQGITHTHVLRDYLSPAELVVAT